ncbi:hypothetical protein [Candidatus Entotheonella palauensis]|uniref:hypothetical protein n=1 Tax=Candidatus Entotheonella palauensis TaxID=93172 RepID=UPI000B7DF664|nr:hypothetical protein [Candidatus Entotheonella palauensis]
MVASLSHGQKQGRVAAIPVIDLAPYLSGEPGALPHAAEQLREALETNTSLALAHRNWFFYHH